MKAPWRLKMLKIRILEKTDIPEVVEGWNRSLVHDKVTQDEFESVILKDPNYEKEGNIIGVYQGKIVGFVSAVALKGAAGYDAAGKPSIDNNGYIKGLFVLDAYWDMGVGEKLLEQAEAYLKSKGKGVIKVVEYSGGRYFFPGIDLRYDSLLDFFAEQGYERALDWGEPYIINDLTINLTDFKPTTYHKRAIESVANIGVQIAPYHPDMLERMRTFVEKLKYWYWFPEGWEERFSESEHTLVALKGKEIVGWASYWPEEGGFGPTGVLEAYRGHSIGTCLLLESMLKMKELGVPKVIAGWAATEFYLRSGWEICRQYAPFQKILQINDA
jgi:GNAT superfamily N-acetyltransferase